MILLGIHALEQQEQSLAQDKARILGTTLLQRIQESPQEPIERLLAHVADTTKSTLIYIQQEEVQAAHPSQPLSANQLSELQQLPVGLHPSPRADEWLYVAGPSSDSRLLVLTPLSNLAYSHASLITSLITFALLLLAGTAVVAWALARDVHEDVLYLRKLIVGMADEEQVPEHHLIPVRTIDQVGQLTASFNVLLERFHAAERAYRQDLSGAQAFERDRSAFLSALSHELRTPLNAILGFTDVLLSEMDGPLSDESKENLTIVRQSGEHLRSLIDDILTLSALESGEFRLSPEQLDIYQVAQDVVTEARLSAEQKGIQLRLERAPAEISLVASADRRRMRQVLGNLINNAVKFTHQGSVHVMVTRAPSGSGPEEIQVIVRDTGPGIAADARERIFDEFEQSSSGRAERSGTGLGLSITRRLVHLHGGHIEVESEEGVGSTFTIHLPLELPALSE